MIPKITSLLFTYGPSVISGILLSLSFPGADLSFLAFIALVPWLLSIPSLTAKQAFKSGLIAGLVHFVTLLYWLVYTVHIYGGLNPLLSVLLLLFLSLYLALYLALFSFLYNKLPRSSVFTPFLAACLWAGLEYIRTYAFTGFSWGSLGYSQYANLTFIQLADITGVYGISFLIVLINYFIADWIVYFMVIKTPLKNICYKNALKTSIMVLMMLVPALIYGHLRLSEIKTIAESAPKASLTVVQGNIDQNIKWNEAFKTQTTEKYIRLSEKAFADSSDRTDLIIWPESALPFYYGYERILSDKINRFIQKTGTHFLIGSPAFQILPQPDIQPNIQSATQSSENNNKVNYFNRAYMLNPFSIVTGTYDKNHLVPFGEYVPLEKYLPFPGKMVAQVSDFSPGDGKFIPLKFKDHKTGIIICFEILFPHIASEFVKNGSNMLITLTNDAWFGKTAAPYQHFSLSVLRAVESRRTLARAANTGISGFISPTGKILEQSELFTDTALTKQIPSMSLISLYTRFGDVFAIAAIIVFCFGFVLKTAIGDNNRLKKIRRIS